VESEGYTLDSGALIAIERGDRGVTRMLKRAASSGMEVHIVTGVLAQTWRGGSRQARLARFLQGEEVVFVPLDRSTAEAVGLLCGLTGHADVVDVHVVLHARSRGHTVVTSDPDDLRRVDRRIPLITL